MQCLLYSIVIVIGVADIFRNVFVLDAQDQFAGAVLIYEKKASPTWLEKSCYKEHDQDFLDTIPRAFVLDKHILQKIGATPKDLKLSSYEHFKPGTRTGQVSFILCVCVSLRV